MGDQDQYRDVFITEAQELTASLETDLVELEGEARDPELINRIFRAAHTMKSSAAMFGFPQIAELTHSMESVLDRVRDGVLAIDAEVVNTLLEALDVLRLLVDDATEGNDTDHGDRLRPLCQRLRAVAEAVAGGGPSEAAPEAAPAEGEAAAGTTYRVHMALNEDVFFQGTNPMLLLDELATLGEVEEVCCDTSRLPELEELDPLKLYLAWDVTLRAEASLEQVEEVFLFCRDDGDIRVERAGADTGRGGEAAGGESAARDGGEPPAAAGPAQE
ncbi:MAG: hypothetical protein D6739_05245, partial [Nitrospirae bacterium]